MVYTCEFLLSHAAKADLWDKLQADGFDKLLPEAEKVWSVLTGGKAAEILTPVLLFGNVFPRVD